MRKLAWYVAVCLATLAVAFLVWELRTVLILFILSLAVAAILRPTVSHLTTHKLPRWLALVITYLGVVVLIVSFVLLFGRPIMAEIQKIATDLPGGYEQLKNQWLAGSGLQQALAQSLPDLNNLFPITASGQWNNFMVNLLGITMGMVTVISEIAVVFILSIYWNAGQEHFKRLWLSILPYESRTRWRDVWLNIENEIGSYLRSEFLQSLLTVIILGIGYQLIGLPYPILIAIFGAISWLFVWFGGLVAIAFAFVAGFLVSPVIGLLAALFTLVVLAFLEFIVEPRIFNRQRLSSLLVLIMVIIMVRQYGIIGILAAPPIAVAIQIIAKEIYRTTTTASLPIPPPPDIQIELLKERLRNVQAIINSRSDPPGPEISSLIDRLDKLIARANQENGNNE